MRIKIQTANLVIAAIVMMLSMVAGVIVKGSNTANAIPDWQPAAVTKVSTGNAVSCAIAGGAAYCWGSNDFGLVSLGNNTTTSSNVPIAVDTSGVLAGKTVTDISVGRKSACVVASGAAYCWGSNSYGSLGDGSTVGSDIPIAVDTSGVLAGKTVTDISTKGETTCAIASGSLYCWGRNNAGQLGDGTTTDSDVPVAVSTSGVLAGKTATQVSVGNESTCAIASGSLYCWGLNSAGQLGDGTTTDSNVPIAVDTSGVLAGKTVTDISTGVQTFSACAIAAGDPYCWGSSGFGLGDGTTTSSDVPVAVNTTGVLAGKTATQLSVDGGSVCVVAAAAPYCWGSNSYGQLGNGTRTNSSIPVAVNTTDILSGKSATQISLGSTYACVVASGAGYCWGGDSYGQLGDGVRALSRTTPVPVTSRVPISSDKAVTEVSFDTINNKKIMTIKGEYMMNYPDAQEWTKGVMGESLVSLNGVALDWCSDGIGYTAAELAGAGLAGATDSQPCYYLIDMYNTPLIDDRVAKIYLPDNFDLTDEGTVSVNGSDEFTYNADTGEPTDPEETIAPTASVSGKSLMGTPTISKRPTFSGVATPGSTVTVTVHSDPISCTTTADSNGNWSCTLPSDLEPGQHTVNIRVIAPDNSVTDLGPYSVTVPGGSTITNQTPLAPMTGEQRLAAVTSPQVLLIVAAGIFTLGTLLYIGYSQLRVIYSKQ